MKTLAAAAVVLVALAPAATAQTAPGFTGKWEGTFTIQRPDGTEGDPRPVVFNLTQKGKDLTGTGGPIVKERLQGAMTGERDGVVQGKAKVDAAKAK